MSTKAIAVLGQHRRHAFIVRSLIVIMVCCVIALLAMLNAVSAQRVPPPAGPADAAAGMYTLQDIHDRLDSGATAGTPGALSQPATGPTVVSGLPSIDDIVALLPVVDNTNCAAPGDVVSGKTFFGLCGTSWGARTGTASVDPILAATGQNTCYNAAGTVITCAGTGQDGEYQLGATASPRFTDNSNGTVTDNLTGLIWLKNANCSATLGGVAKTTTLVWANALTWSNNLASGSCGLTDGSVAGDWRVPNITELESLVDLQNSSPSLPTGHPFTSVVASFYWSSTSGVSNPSNAWFVNFNTGAANLNTKTTSSYVWPVR
jgi:hypothetical protein